MKLSFTAFKAVVVDVVAGVLLLALDKFGARLDEATVDPSPELEPDDEAAAWDVDDDELAAWINGWNPPGDAA